MPFTVVDVQPTPNPNAAKFLLDKPITEQPMSFFNAAAAQGHPIATRLFEVTGVTSVLLLGDFVTVNKTAAVRWDAITPKVRKILEEVQK
jgi:hypothetical protein